MDAKYRMRIEVPIGRISISKATLHAMNDPEFIELAIEPKSLALRILRAPYGLRVKMTKAGEFYITSKELMEGLCSLIPYLNEPCSYRLSGEVFGDGMRFSMDTLEKIGRTQIEGTQHESTEH